MNRYDIHLVGSIPLPTARDVFRTVSDELGPGLVRLPDGETGERLKWLGWFEPVFSCHPAFERTGEVSRVHASSDPRPLHRLKPGVTASRLSFPNLRIAENAVASFKEFQLLQEAGIVPDGCRFQVGIANPISVVHRFVLKQDQATVVAAYEQAMIEEIQRLAALIPNNQLAVQIDIAQHVFTPLETGEKTRFGATREEMLRNFSDMAVYWGQAVPGDAELLFHLCYGDNQHRHAVEPKSLAVAVEFSNLLSRKINRSIELIHMPVPRDRDDDAYFEPLRRLALRQETRIALGLIHQTDGIAGGRRRMTMAKKYLDTFLIATECGFGRRSAGSIPSLLRLHAELAGIR